MKVHLYSLRDQSCEKQVWFNIKLASGLYTGVSHSLFKHDELSLIIWWMMYFFYDHVLVKPQRSSSLHSFWVCLADLKAFSCLMCDKCVPARRLSWVYACLLIVTIIGFKSSTIFFLKDSLRHLCVSHVYCGKSVWEEVEIFGRPAHGHTFLQSCTSKDTEKAFLLSGSRCAWLLAACDCSRTSSRQAMRRRIQGRQLACEMKTCSASSVSRAHISGCYSHQPEPTRNSISES